MSPKMSLGIMAGQQMSRVTRVEQVQTLAAKQQVSCVQKAVQECSLCKQAVSAKQQVPLSTILFEGYGMCPSCGQRVRHEIVSTSWYRRRWSRRFKEISKARGWGWQAP